VISASLSRLSSGRPTTAGRRSRATNGLLCARRTKIARAGLEHAASAAPADRAPVVVRAPGACAIGSTPTRSTWETWATPRALARSPNSSRPASANRDALHVALSASITPCPNGLWKGPIRRSLDLPASTTRFRSVEGLSLAVNRLTSALLPTPYSALHQVVMGALTHAYRLGPRSRENAWSRIAVELRDRVPRRRGRGGPSCCWPRRLLLRPLCRSSRRVRRGRWARRRKLALQHSRCTNRNRESSGTPLTTRAATVARTAACSSHICAASPRREDGWSARNITPTFTNPPAGPPAWTPLGFRRSISRGGAPPTITRRVGTSPIAMVADQTKSEQDQSRPSGVTRNVRRLMVAVNFLRRVQRVERRRELPPAGAIALGPRLRQRGGSAAMLRPRKWQRVQSRECGWVCRVRLNRLSSCRPALRRRRAHPRREKSVPATSSSVRKTMPASLITHPVNQVGMPEALSVP